MMNRGKEPSPLFEIINKTQRSKRRGVRVPDWMRQAADMEEQVEAAAPTVPPAKGAPPRWLEWWYRPVRFRLQVGVLALCGIAVTVVVIVTLFVGMEIQRRRAMNSAMDYEQQVRSVQQAQRQPPNYGLITRGVERASPVPTGVTPPPGSAGAAGDPSDPREAGMNYFRLVELPGSGGVKEGRRAVEFLRGNGIDAVLISINNGKSYKLMVTRAFAPAEELRTEGRPNIGSKEAKDYSEKLKSLGRLWKAKHGGSSDWHDLFAEKYIPGRT